MKPLLAVALVVAALCGAGCQTAQGKKMRLAPADRAADLHASTGTFNKSPLPLTLYFETDAVTLDRASMDALDDWGDYLRKHRDARLTITGHADDRGTTEYNLGLGEARAFTARRYLVTLGANSEQIAVVSFGEERPVVAGTADGMRAKNRRDELKISFHTVASNTTH